ncbi:MAG TPA: sulfite exporter TauE/SafE family protein [Candidatus Limnocylindrales bacterium]|jgi:ABC-type nickel/cobalt efflux system permease component RcnA
MVPRVALTGAAALVAAALMLAAHPGAAAAHPLGNFTINHYAGIAVGPDAIQLDLVIDLAEIPTFEERARLDRDNDGDVSDAEIAASRDEECRALERAVQLAVDQAAQALVLEDAALSFPMGAGLPTMRLECRFGAAVTWSAAPRTVRFVDAAYSAIQGWREIVVSGDRVTIAPVDGDYLAQSASERLTRYPEDRLSSPLAMDFATFTVVAGGPAASVAPSTPPGLAGTGWPAVFGATDLSPLVLLVALLTAAAIGAGHALTPGHGKTVMAAWLVGSRGSASHAVGLGLAVTVSHTLGVLLLAAVVLVAQRTLPATIVAEALPLVAALGIVAIGAWMFAGELLDLRRRRRHAHHAHAHEPRPPGRVTWRGLFALGLVGGIVPSTSALLILLGAIAAGRPAFGIVLVVAFGLGMAAILTGVGLLTVVARGRVERLAGGSRLAAAWAYMPLLAAAVVLAVGAWLTAQSLLRGP